MKLLILVLPVLLLAISVSVAILLVKRGHSPKRAMAVHFLSLIVIGTLCLGLPMTAAAEPDAESASASDTAETETQTAGGMSDKSMAYIGAGLAVGIAAVGGIAVASAAPAAIGATAEDPKNFGKSIIFVALGEGFGLYGLLIAIMMLIL